MTDDAAEPSVEEMLADLVETVEDQQAVIDRLVERQGTLAEALQDAAVDTDEIEEVVEAAVRAGAGEALGTGDDDGLEYPEPDNRYFQ
jgi:hypothetical protein